MKSHLIEIEKRALQLRNAGQLQEAADLFSVIVTEQPDWEHGTGFYSLACCYEDLGKFPLARQFYCEALRYEPKNPYFLGGLASFLYIHGDPNEAFNQYLKLLNIERNNRHQKGVDAATIALRSLGEKMGLSPAELAQKIGF